MQPFKLSIALAMATLAVLPGCGSRAVPEADPVESSTTSVDANASSPTLAEAWNEIPGAKTKQRGDAVVVVDLREVSEGDYDAAKKLLSRSNDVAELFMPGAAWGDGTVLRLAALPKLRRVRVYGKEFDDAKAKTMSGLPALVAVTFQDTSVTDEGAAVLAELNELVDVSLMNSPVTDQVLKSISTLPKLTKLKLRGTKITGEAFGPIAKLPLVDLELAETDFGPAGMQAISEIEGLQKLNLWLTKVDDESMKAIEGKTSLTVLNLDNCSFITEGSIPVITSLPKLTLLHLGKSKVAPEALPELKVLQEMQTLFVNDLGLEEDKAMELKAMFPKLERFVY
ncbi:leucine-rich repeat domain-containing protein [Rhodopirellula halodulae]|uniref:leucine-rich repeat domain-containing protein n=1 Tax=Rhodopirellula halodulae TaxID=2894198 RepID=UPI001E4DD9F3|nr:G protein-coupled receptor LGR4 [Rhodopirellula sp. JC737]MCC9655983.1 G protein-coupled receptor LGR4 [Rhodopirellula sp. JC737]